ncbi:hypothetical protein H0H81_012633 [Sphagnurus paluster]|uniref:Uncharacterized protein n=1 Tax=Sphagnurus paluster TaxID=117069 RepID=A0A9P7FUE8_9AGAR|nr:hypothetical protein H0H81_012633 [Sphagnurus paluster]
MALHTDHDELDILSPTDPSVFYASKTTVDKSKAALRRSTRPRQSLLQLSPAKPKARKRKISTSGLECAVKNLALKKIKLDEKKVQTGVLNQKKEARDEARKKWLYCHRSVIEPLLPPTSMFYDQLQREVERNWKGAVFFTPTKFLDQQPKLIRAGQMKDYQARICLNFAMYRTSI